jgi:hypothetical protein
VLIVIELIHIKKDMTFVNQYGYQVVLRKLCRYGLDESRHLLHQYGSVPCIDAETWEKHRGEIDEIYIRTQRGKVFRANAGVFERMKEEIEFGHGRQYFMPIEYWNVHKPVPPADKPPQTQSQLPLAHPSLSATEPPPEDDFVTPEDIEREFGVYNE